MEWIESEFAWLELGDLRREKRVKTIVEQFSRIAEAASRCQEASRPSIDRRLADRLTNSSWSEPGKHCRIETVRSSEALG
ncbi:IS4/Tn5 family transposase DNA-binding protein [Allorhodopirellula solitaria]|uniref:IS4/Tn5 family transposase DNA-binding protein n=1 Tax=Allorhodopirellula solitaria TaxID=2527987 RepID=UPI0011B650A6